MFRIRSFHGLAALSYCALLTGVSPISRAHGEDWPTFRGSDRTGVSSESGLLDEWPANGPDLAWTATGAGRGYACPAVSNGKIFTLGDGPSTASDADEYLTCFDESTGKQLWKTKTGNPWNEGQKSWQGSRSTPTVDDDRVYVITPFGKLVCAMVKDGSIVWQKDLKSEFSGSKRDSWGYSESPLVDGDRLICTPGGEEATVVALDKTSGDLIWKCSHPSDVGAGHSSVVISEIDGRKIYVQNTGGGPIGIDAETGKLLWEYGMNPPTAFIPTPVIDGDMVFAVAGYGLGGALIKQVVDQDSVTVQEIYGPKKDLGNKHGGVVLVDGQIFGGIEDRNTVYRANMSSGEPTWETKRGSGSGSTSVVAADGKLFVRFADGIVALVNTAADEYDEISAFKTPGSGDSPSWAHPVIANGKLFLREGDSILCYDISK